MVKTFSSSTQNHEQTLTQIKFRFKAKLFVLLASYVSAIIRLSLAFSDPQIDSNSIESFLYSLPFPFALSVIVCVEYLIYRKYGLSILKCSKFIDVLLSVAFTGDWLFSLYGMLIQPENTVNVCFTLSALISLTSFSWRTLLQLLITRYWPLKIVPPVAAYILLVCYALLKEPEHTLFIVVRGILQVFFVVAVFYFEHKINFMLAIGNMEQEQWLKLNEFILNNIPENIVMIDLKGGCYFVNEHFKKFIIRSRQPRQDIKQFFQNIRDIHQQPQQNTEENNQYNNSENNNIIEIRSQNCDSRPPTQEITSLEHLINIFQGSIEQGFVKEREFQIFEGKFKHDDDTQERSFEIKISFINQQKTRYILLILRDTTQRDMLLTLEGNIKYKDHLLASVSHELRAPLNGNINLLEAAIKSRDGFGAVRETLLIPALKSSKFLLHLINDILDMSQIKAQKLRLVFQNASLRETLVNTIQLLDLHAKKKGIKLEIDINLGSSDAFCTDHMRLSQIILNLMNNSIKFTQNGFIKISARLVTQTKNWVRISVEDTGIGMTESDIGKLFKDFTHIEYRNRELINPTGIGLGLKIANDLAKLLGPNDLKGILVTSEPNKGSIFSFDIENKQGESHSTDNLEAREDEPLLVADEFPIETESSLALKVLRDPSTKSLFKPLTREISSVTGKFPLCSCSKVLLVDDDPFNMMAYEVILSSLRVKFEGVFSGKTAIEKMLTRVRNPCSVNCCGYQVVFMDEEMPGMTGKETVAEIGKLQKQNLLPKVSIVGCTAHHSQEEIEKFVESGIVECVIKPISKVKVEEILLKHNVMCRLVDIGS